MVKQRISIKDVDIAINGKIVGGAQEATVTISRDNEEAYEGGNYMPVEIVGGKFHIKGSLTRAFIDNDLLKELMPKQAVPASFTITGSVTSGKTPNRNFTVFGATFESIEIGSLALDGYAVNTLPFTATDFRLD
jgi:hypothetical protein